MQTKGRHVTQNVGGIAPEYHDIQGINKPMKLVGTVQEDGRIRLDDENHPEFWLEITLSKEDLNVLSQNSAESLT